MIHAVSIPRCCLLTLLDACMLDKAYLLFVSLDLAGLGADGRRALLMFRLSFGESDTVVRWIVCKPVASEAAPVRNIKMTLISDFR